MKLNEILTEGISFHAATYEEHPKFGRVITQYGMRKERVECWVCDGTGKDSYDEDYPCDMCKGDGKIEEWISDGPELSVSVGNARTVIEDILGVEFDHAGMIPPEDLPELKRRLIRLKNMPSRMTGLEQPTRVSGGEMRRFPDEGGVAQIGRTAQMVNLGRSGEQVMNYVEQLLNIVEYAQKNGIFLSWS